MEVKTEKSATATSSHEKPLADDVGIAAIAEVGEVEDFTAEEEKAVRWKIDLHLMPLVSIHFPHLIGMPTDWLTAHDHLPGPVPRQVQHLLLGTLGHAPGCRLARNAVLLADNHLLHWLSGR